MTGPELKALRQQVGIADSEFAAMLGVARRTIYRWEAMGKAPSLVKHAYHWVVYGSIGWVYEAAVPCGKKDREEGLVVELEARVREAYGDAAKVHEVGQKAAIDREWYNGTANGLRIAIRAIEAAREGGEG